MREIYIGNSHSKEILYATNVCIESLHDGHGTINGTFKCTMRPSTIDALNDLRHNRITFIEMVGGRECRKYIDIKYRGFKCTIAPKDFVYIELKWSGVDDGFHEVERINGDSDFVYTRDNALSAINGIPLKDECGIVLKSDESGRTVAKIDLIQWDDDIAVDYSPFDVEFKDFTICFNHKKEDMVILIKSPSIVSMNKEIDGPYDINESVTLKGNSFRIIR